MMYDRSLQEKWDYENVLAYAEQKKYAEGRQEGRQEGKQEGRQEGKQEGIHEEKLVTARKLKVKGYSAEEISEITELPIAEIEKL